MTLLINLNQKKLTYDKTFSCDLCEYKCHATTIFKADSLLGIHYNKIHGGVPKKRRKLNSVEVQSENIEIELVSSRIGENVKSEKPEDEVEFLEENPEENVPFKKAPISKAVEIKSPISVKEKPKFSLKGLMNKSNVKIVTSIKVFKCDICKQEWVQNFLS